MRNDDLRDFLVARRGALTPERSPLPALSRGERRVPGLRREEVAETAGVSEGYYTRLERGDVRNPSSSVLNAVARALQLTDVERLHLLRLAGDEIAAASAPAAASGRTPPRVRASLRRVIDTMSAPAVIIDVARSLVGANLMGRALFAPHFEAEEPNLARFVFLDPRAERFYDDWDSARRTTAAILRLEMTRYPRHAGLSDLVCELSDGSASFRRAWAHHEVHSHRGGLKIFHHPVVGELGLSYDVMQVPGPETFSVMTYTAEDDGPTQRRLIELENWAVGQAPVA